MFQFQCGAIVSRLYFLMDEAGISFNSSVVRLLGCN